MELKYEQPSSDTVVGYNVILKVRIGIIEEMMLGIQFVQFYNKVWWSWKGNIKREKEVSKKQRNGKQNYQY